MDVAWAFRCDTCHYQVRLKNAADDPTSSSGCCPACGSVAWRIYAKDDQGHVRVVG